MNDTETSRLTLTVREAAAMAGLGLNSMHDALRRGDFASIRIGRRVLIPRAAFERALAGEAPADSRVS